MFQKFFNVGVVLVIIMQGALISDQLNTICSLTELSAECVKEINYLHERINQLEKERAPQPKKEEESKPHSGTIASS